MRIFRNQNTIVSFLLIFSLLFFGGLNFFSKTTNASPGTAVYGSTPVVDGRIFAIAISGDTVFIGGDFSTVGGQARNYLASYSLSTGAVDAWDPNLNSTVYALAIADGKLYVGGDFTTVNGGGTTRRSLAAYTVSDGSLDASWDPDLDAFNAVFALAVTSTKVYAGGQFTSVNGGGTLRNRLAAFQIANDSNLGTVDAAWNPNVSNHVLAIAVSGSKVYVGGKFTTVNGGALVARGRAAAFNEADGVDVGTVDATWNPTSNDYVHVLLVSGSDIYAGGAFSIIGGQNRSRIAKLNNTTGAADGTWDPNVDNCCTVYSLALDGTSLYVGGDFTTAQTIGSNAVNRNYIAEISTAGTGAATSWDPLLDLNNLYGVAALGISGGSLVVGGDFTEIDGDGTHPYLAQFNSPQIAFTASSSSGLESVTPANIGITLHTILGVDATVDYAVTGGTATGGGVDYTLAAGTATVTAGGTTTTIPITIVDDGTVEVGETIQITLSNPSNASLGSNTVHTYTITDNDVAPAGSTTTTGSVVNSQPNSIDIPELLIDNGEGVTDTPMVELTFDVEDADTMEISNFEDLHDADPESYSGSHSWNICEGLSDCDPGTYTVYAQFFDAEGAVLGAFEDSIIYDPSNSFGGNPLLANPGNPSTSLPRTGSGLPLSNSILILGSVFSLINYCFRVYFAKLKVTKIVVRSGHLSYRRH
jgi:hypothetical protein